jgi:hypothetical protein
MTQWEFRILRVQSPNGRFDDLLHHEATKDLVTQLGNLGWAVVSSTVNPDSDGAWTMIVWMQRPRPPAGQEQDVQSSDELPPGISIGQYL